MAAMTWVAMTAWLGRPRNITHALPSRACRQTAQGIVLEAARFQCVQGRSAHPFQSIADIAASLR